MSNELDITPEFEVLRKQFSREARLNADTILANLLPETMIEPENIKAVQLAVLRAFQSVLNRIDIATQCTTNLKQLLELREVAHYVSETIIAKANAIEDALAREDEDEPEAEDDLFLVFNATDGVFATPDAMTHNEAIGFIEGFVARYKEQGTYKTANGHHISPDEIELELKAAVVTTPPHHTYMTSDGYKLHWNGEHLAWHTGKSWEDRDMVFNAVHDGRPMDRWAALVDGDYIVEEEK